MIKYIYAIACCLVVCVTSSLPAIAQTPDANSGAGHPKVLANGFAHMVLQEGVYACAERVNQVTTFLGGIAGSSGGVAMIRPDQPNSRLFPLSMEVQTETGSAFASASFAPNQANGCGAAYDAVVYWPQNCLTVAALRFGAFKKSGLLGKNIVVLDGGNTTKVFLMPADTGCVSIKQEVIM